VKSARTGVGRPAGGVMVGRGVAGGETLGGGVGGELGCADGPPGAGEAEGDGTTEAVLHAAKVTTATSAAAIANLDIVDSK
jgi:hypothetical protein